MRKRTGIALVAATLSALLAAAPAFAGPYTRLQVLMPGETAAPGTTSGKTGTARPQVAGVPFTVTVNACDSQWNVVTSVTNSISMQSSDQSATLPPSNRLASGTQTFQVTFNAFNQAGTFQVYAHDETDGTIPDGASAGVVVQVMTGYSFSPNFSPGSSQRCGVPFQVTITARSPANNIVTGFYGSVNLKEETNFGDGPVSPASVTLTAGSWTGDVTVFRADESSIKGANVYAWYPPDPTIDGSSDAFNCRPGSFARLQLVLPGQVQVPGSQSGLTGSPADQVAGRSFTAAVFATDTWWNEVSSQHDVRLTSTDPLGVPSPSTGLTGTMSNGRRYFTATLATVGLQTLTIRDIDNASIIGMTSEAVNVVPASADHFLVNTIASPQIAGVPVSVTIRAVDVNNNTVTDFNGPAVLIANTGQGSISPETVTFTSGVWTGPMTFKGAGALVRFQIADFTSPPHTGTSNYIEVRAGPIAKLQVLLPGESPKGGTAPGHTGTPDPQTAGATFTTTVRAVDAYWNLVSGVTDRVALRSSDQFAWLPAETTLVDGQILVPTRLALSGQQRIWASDVDNPAVASDTSSYVTVNGGSFSQLLILAPGESPAPGTVSGRTGTPTDQSVGYAFNVTVLATDQWWNPVTGPTDVVHITSSDTGPQTVLPPDTPMVNGRVELSVKLTTGNYQQITASDVTQPSKNSSTTSVRMINSGFHLEATVAPTTVGAGEPFTLTVRVTNAAGSVIQDVNSFVTVEVQNASTRQPGIGTLSNTYFQLLQGQKAVAETYTFVEPIVLIVRDDAGNAPAITEAVTVVPGTPSKVVFDNPPTWVGGSKTVSLTAKLTDYYDNGIPDQVMAFRLRTGAGSVAPTDSITDGSGAATTDFTSPRDPETDTIRASSNGLFADLDIETALVNPSAPGGYVTNYPNPFRPPTESTVIAWKLVENATVTLKIYSQSGGLVRQETFSSGAPGGTVGLNQWSWDGLNGSGSTVASGGYLVLIEAQGTQVMRRKIAAVRSR